MRAIIELNLPDEQIELLAALKGARLFDALKEMDQNLWSRLKYGNLDEATYNELMTVRRELLDLIQDVWSD